MKRLVIIIVSILSLLSITMSAMALVKMEKYEKDIDTIYYGIVGHENKLEMLLKRIEGLEK